MSTPFTQLNDQPIQRDMPIASNAGGIEAFSQVLGQVSNKLMQTGLQIEQEKSAALLLNEVTLFAQGIQKTQGLFNNGENWPLLKQRMEALNNKNGLLTQTGKGERARLQHLIKGFNAGDYYAQIIQATPQGQALLKDYAQNYNSVDPHTAYNDYISRSVQLGHAMQIDNHFIQPTPNDLDQIDCLSNYSKIFDEKNNIYEDHPLHDWTSHAVDAYHTMTLVIENQLINERASEIVYYI